LKEAYQIKSGVSINPKKEHIFALVDVLNEMGCRLEKLNSLMNIAYQEACKNRQSKGLPIPPIPDSLKPYVK
jgi:hypothetical protein